MTFFPQFRNNPYTKQLSTIFDLQFQNMNRILSFILLSLALFVLTDAQATQATVAYIEGCAQYALDGCCQSCEYAYTLSNNKCLPTTNTTADCCSSYNSDGSCAQCAAGLFSADPYCNRNQIYGCIKKSGNTCLACGSGLSLQNGVCFTIIANCQNYSNVGECLGCNSGFALVNSYCVEYPQVSNCAQANFYGCIQCSNGYYLTKGRTCSAFQPGCLQYFQEKCTVCLPTFTLSGGACVIDGCAIFGSTGCSQCQSGYTLDKGRCFINNCAKAANGICLLCHPDYRLSANGCVQAASYSCKACQSGFIFANNRCIQVINGCNSYTTSNTCATCLPKFQLTVNGLCQILGCSAYSSTGCTTCNSPFQLDSQSCVIANCLTLGVNGCTSCSSNYLTSNGQCVPVDPYCQTYSGSTCSQCKPKYHLVGGLCVQNDRGCVYNSAGQCSCAGNYVLSSSGKCIILGCSSYDSNYNCLACQSPFTFNNTAGYCYISFCQTYTESCCKACSSGYSLFNGVCQQTDIYCTSYNSNGLCATCQSGFFLSVSGKCLKNIPNCANFNDQTTCQNCQTGYLLFNNQCLLPLANCQTQSASAWTCVTCSTGYHLDQGNCAVNDCNCATYTLQSNTQVCTACANGYQLISGQCIKSQPGCVYTGTACSSCLSPFTFDASSNSCFIFGCTSYSLSGCLACKSPFSLSNNACAISNCDKFNKDCCAACSSGYSLSNGICVSLDLNCIKFADNQCTTCKTGYTLLNGKCVIKDVNCESYNSDGVCSKCASVYYLDSSKRCQPRDNGCVYEGGKCKFCNPPFVLNSLANTCVIKNCLQTQSSGCVLCQSPFIVGSDKGCTLPNCNNVQNNACVQCNAGYHLKNGVQCEADSSDCLSYDCDGNCQLCKKGLTLNSNAVCSSLNSTCLQTCKSDKFKCLSCASGYFLNKFYQCEKQDGKCTEYTNGVCSQCAEKYFLHSEICFPYTVGCVQYSGKDCTTCRSGYTLKNGECFAWNQQGIGLLGLNDIYNFSIAPIDVRQSKYYINNLSPGSEIGKFFFSSYSDATYQDCSLSTLSGASGKGWKAATSDSAQFIGLVVSDEPATFYAIQLQAVEGNYVTEFYLEYSVDGVNFIRVQNYFTVPASVSANMTTIYFTGIYAKAIRIKISKFQGWPAARIEFFYYDTLRFKKISNLKSIKYLLDTINSNFVDRVNNQIYINQAYFFNPTAACTSQDMCFTGLQLCQPRQINSVNLSFGAGGSVSEFYLTYSMDGRSYNCYNGCAKIAVPVGANANWTYSFSSNFNAQGIRIYPTKYTGSPSFSPAFFYQ